MDIGWKVKDPQMYHDLKLNLGGNELISGGVWEFAGCVCVSMVLGCLVVLWGFAVVAGYSVVYIGESPPSPGEAAHAEGVCLNLRRRIVRGHCGLD